jgi:hypothetical protein
MIDYFLLPEAFDVSVKPAATIVCPEDGCNKFLHKLGTFVRKYRTFFSEDITVGIEQEVTA